jgi:hypothetical protein
MNATTDHGHKGHHQSVHPPTDARAPEGPMYVTPKRRTPLKRSNDDRSVPTGGRLTPISTRWGIRGMHDFTVEELARLHQKLDGWIGQRAHDPERPRHQPWVMQPKRAHPA